MSELDESVKSVLDHERGKVLHARADESTLRSLVSLTKGTNTCVVHSGKEAMALQAGEPVVRAVSFAIPENGPICYHGRLFSVRWEFKASIDIPWTFDPKESYELIVLPRTL